MHLRKIQRTLAQRAGKAPDASAVAEASLRTWAEVADRLAPVIGKRGVDALFNRSLHLTSKTYPWLGVARGDERGAARLEQLKARLVAHEADSAAQASGRLLHTFSELLATLIGESLTERLLEPIWAPPEPDAEQENSE